MRGRPEPEAARLPTVGASSGGVAISAPVPCRRRPCRPARRGPRSGGRAGRAARMPAASWRSASALGPGPAAGRLDRCGGLVEVGLGQRLGRAYSWASRLPAAVPEVRATTTGTDFLRARRSESTGLPVTSGSPQMPSRSSMSWKASPMWSPNSASPWLSGTGAPASTAPSDDEQAISAAVLSAAIARHSSSVTSSRFSNATSALWPAISRRTVVPSRLHRGRRGPGVRLGQHLVGEGQQGVAGEDRVGRSRTAPTPSAGAGVRCRRRSGRRAAARSCAPARRRRRPGTPCPAGAPAATAESRASAGTHALAAAGPDRRGLAVGVPEAEVVAGRRGGYARRAGRRRPGARARPGRRTVDAVAVWRSWS